MMENMRARHYQAGLEREDELPLKPLNLLLGGGEMSWTDNLLLLLIFVLTSIVNI